MLFRNTQDDRPPTGTAPGRTAGAVSRRGPPGATAGWQAYARAFQSISTFRDQGEGSLLRWLRIAPVVPSSFQVLLGFRLLLKKRLPLLKHQSTAIVWNL